MKTTIQIAKKKRYPLKAAVGLIQMPRNVPESTRHLATNKATLELTAVQPMLPGLQHKRSLLKLIAPGQFRGIRSCCGDQQVLVHGGATSSLDWTGPELLRNCVSNPLMAAPMGLPLPEETAIRKCSAKSMGETGSEGSSEVKRQGLPDQSSFRNFATLNFPGDATLESDRTGEKQTGKDDGHNWTLHRQGTPW